MSGLGVSRNRNKNGSLSVFKADAKDLNPSKPEP